MNEETLEWMAKNDPSSLLELIRSGLLAPPILTYAAEIAGIIDDPMAVQEALLPLLDHQDAVVREGAIYGLAQCWDASVANAFSSMAKDDRSQAVRLIAKSFLRERSVAVEKAKSNRRIYAGLAVLWFVVTCGWVWQAIANSSYDTTGIIAAMSLVVTVLFGVRAYHAHRSLKSSKK